MKRIHLYLNEDIWKALKIASRQQGTPIPELVRQAVRDRYGKVARAARTGNAGTRRHLEGSSGFARINRDCTAASQIETPQRKRNLISGFGHPSPAGVDLYAELCVVPIASNSPQR